jgi:hypothetical protein
MRDLREIPGNTSELLDTVFLSFDPAQLDGTILLGEPLLAS